MEGRRAHTSSRDDLVCFECKNTVMRACGFIILTRRTGSSFGCVKVGDGKMGRDEERRRCV